MVKRSRIVVSDPARVIAALAWVDEVYPDTTLDGGAANINITWEQWNALRASLGLPMQRPSHRRVG